MAKEIIYKYASCEDAIKTIQNNSIVLNNPLNYNDPFDSIIDIDIKDENKTISLLMEVIFVKEIFKLFNNKDIKLKWHQKPISWFNRVMYKFLLWGTKKQRYYNSNPIFRFLTSIVLNFATKNNDDALKQIEEAKTKFINEMLPKLKEIRNNALVSCFSKKNDSILMWGHYADKHTGICLGFERPNNDFFDVVYKKKRSKFPLYDLACIICSYILVDEKPNLYENKIIKKGLSSFLSKSIDWSYEEEVRCLFSLNNDNEFTFIGNDKYLYHMPTNIKTIYLGCKISKDNKEKIIQLAKEKNIKVYQFIESEKKYELEIE